jgi:uncharacterized membrane protein
VTEEPALFAATNIADAAVGIPWLALLVVLAQLIRRRSGEQPEPLTKHAGPIDNPRPASPVGLGVLLALACASLWASERVSDWTANHGVAVPALLTLTSIALLAAQMPAVHRLGSARKAGLFGVYLFCAVIGASCDLEALAGLGRSGGLLVLFATLVVMIHGLTQFGLGRLLRLSPEVLAIASSANAGGAMTILPVATGLRRMDLLIPGILVGTLGNATGTYAGFLMVGLLRSAP